MSSNHYLDVSEICVLFRAIGKNEIKLFEKEFAQYIGCKYAIGTSYGRTALYLALRAIPVVDREVMVPVFTCPVVRDAVILSGAKPIFIDIEAKSLNMVMADIQRKQTEKTAAIIPTHYYGSMCGNIEEIQAFSKRHNIIVVEDCAHSLGAEYKAKKAGGFGDISVFSLTKNTLNFAGGVLLTNNKHLYEKARLILGKNGKSTVLQGWEDFCLILHYGYLMAVDKIVFDRIGKPVLKWWFRKMPHIIHDLVLPGLRLLEKHTPGNEKRTTFHHASRKDFGQMQPLCNLAMHRLVASVARVQLEKVDELNQRRMIIVQNLRKKLPPHCLDLGNQNARIKNVCTAFPLWFLGHDIKRVAKKCRFEGVRLRKSWPTSPFWWKEEDTTNVRIVGRSLLILEINPMLSDQEIERAGEVIKQALTKSLR